MKVIDKYIRARNQMYGLLDTQQATSPKAEKVWGRLEKFYRLLSAEKKKSLAGFVLID